MEFTSIWSDLLTTAAQVEAAIIALFAVFAVLKLELIEKELNNYREFAIRYTVFVLNHKRQNTKLSKENYYTKRNDESLISDFAEAIKHHENNSAVVTELLRDKVQISESLEDITSRLKLLKGYVSKRLKVLGSLENSLTISLAVIVLAIAFIFFGNVIKELFSELSIPLFLFMLIFLWAIMVTVYKIVDISKLESFYPDE